MLKSHSILLAAFVLFTASMVVAAEPPPAIKFELKRPADVIEVTATDAETVLTLTSKTGIGSAKLQRVGKTWPKQITLKTNLRGLEGLILTQGDRRLQTFLGSDTPETFRRTAADKWEPAKIDKRFLPTIAKGETGIVIQLPAAWLEAGEPELLVEWIDFYRG